MKNKSFNFYIAYIDLLLNVFTAILFISSISLLLQNPKVIPENPGMKKKAEAVIQMDWPPDMNCDVDIWVQDPNGKVVSFQNKDIDLMHIERDDMGWRNDTPSIVTNIQTGQDTFGNQINEEIWVLRGKITGTFNVNIHVYSCTIEGKQLNTGDNITLPVTMTLIRLNPDYQLIKTQTYMMTKVWEEITAFNFHMNENGAIDSITQNVVNLVKVSK